MADSTTPPALSRFEQLYRSGALDAMAEAMNKQLAGAKQSQGWERLGEIHRVRGDLAAAANAYGRAVQLGQASELAEELDRILNHRLCTPAPKDHPPWPAPFVCLDHWLDPSTLKWLREEVGACHEQFEPLGILQDGEKVFDRSVRVGEVVQSKAIGARLRPKVREISKQYCSALGVPSFDIARIELKTTLHEDGGRFTAHVDNLGKVADRRISYVFYFELKPKEFHGGDLLLYDQIGLDGPATESDQEQGDITGRSFTRIRHQDNRLVLFPSGCLHEVVPVERYGDTAGAGRYAVTGHVRAHE